MPKTEPYVRLAHSNNSSVDLNLESNQVVLRLDKGEVRLCRACFQKLAKIMAQANDELRRLDDDCGARPEDQRLEKLMCTLNLDWIQTGLTS